MSLVAVVVSLLVYLPFLGSYLIFLDSVSEPRALELMEVRFFLFSSPLASVIDGYRGGLRTVAVVRYLRRLFR